MERRTQKSLDHGRAKADVLADLKHGRNVGRHRRKPLKVKGSTLAVRAGIRPYGSHESRRRGVRLIIDELRTEGHPIVADFEGYWLALSAQDHAAYQAFLRRMGLGHLIRSATYKRSDHAALTSGQLLMFVRC